MIKESREKETTGEKLIGDEAKGEITIYNYTSSSKNFKEGTIIIGPGDLEFSLDVDVVATAASTPYINEKGEQVIPPGKEKVAVTALNVGPECNLASGTEFDIKGFPSSSYRAKNEKAFSGGTSRKIRVVSAEDREELLADLTAELEEKVKDELEKIAPEGKTILREGVLTSLVSRDFDKAVGAEVDQLKLELEMKAKTLAYSPLDLEYLLEGIISKIIPDGFVEKEKEIEQKEAEIDPEGMAVFKAYLKANLVPDLDIEEIKKNLSGKYQKVAEEYLENLPNFVRAEIIFNPRLPVRLMTFPRLAKNINIKIEIKE